MIERSAEYAEAIVGDSRRMLLKAVVDIISPDIEYGEVGSSSQSSYSNSNQIHDKDFSDPERRATLELNRWFLDGTFEIYPDCPDPDATYKFMGSDICGEDGLFQQPQYVEMKFSNVSVLQACSVYFPSNKYDGVPEDFTVEVKQGGVAYHTESFTGNTNTSVSLDGFTVYNPDAIRVTVSKMSVPNRRFRVVQIVPGVHETWDGRMLASFSLKHQGDVSCVAIPYGTCSIKMDNKDRRFEPRNKSGIFKSIEERQGIDVSMAVRLPSGVDEYKKVGVFYQHSGGWKTGDNGLTMQWDLVDIVGLLVDREFIPPDILPNDLDGWIAALVLQLGENFKDKYTVDPEYKSKPLTVRNRSDVVGLKCGDVLRYACMATGTWPRADAETGYLAAEPLWDQGTKITLSNMPTYPIIKANSDTAAVIFTLNDGNSTQYVVSGNSTASSETISVNNPFIKTKEDALVAARMILSSYGGNRIEIVGRGDPSSEIGDVDTVWLNESQATTARRIQQDLSLTDGVLQNVQSILLQADGSFLFESREVITESGTWTAPSGVNQLRVICVGKGENGTDGTDGSWTEAGVAGTDGTGGKVWSGTININEQQQFTVTIGAESVFGQYSSANGQTYQYGYTDVASGDSFARTGVQNPIPGSGDGGAGGKAGVKGNQHTETIRGTDDEGNPTTDWVTVIDNYPTEGTPGVDGVLGCVVVYWDKEDV